MSKSKYIWFTCNQDLISQEEVLYNYDYVIYQFVMSEIDMRLPNARVAEKDPVIEF